MALTHGLLDQDLTFQCLRCLNSMIRKGSWVKSITTFECEWCHERIRMTYGAKLAIFDRHRHLAAKGRQTDQA